MRRLSALFSMILVFGLLGCQDSIVDATAEDEVLTPEDLQAIDGNTDAEPLQARYDAASHSIIIDYMIENDAVFASVVVDGALIQSGGGGVYVIGAGAGNVQAGFAKIEPGQTEGIVIPLAETLPVSYATPEGVTGLLVTVHTDTHEMGTFEHFNRLDSGSFTSEKDGPIAHDYTWIDPATGNEVVERLPLYAFLNIDR
ncbi:MAG: hypothetical protein AAF730_09520 [Bacteroidota bacterium]